jgi:hypothetical protein
MSSIVAVENLASDSTRIAKTRSDSMLAQNTHLDSSTSPLGNADLLQYNKRSVDEDEEFSFMRFESLQRINITALQLKLARLKDTLRKTQDVSDDELENLRVNMEQYGQCNRVPMQS